MSIESLAVWSQIISSLAILGTLIYLAIETKQNSHTLNAQIREAMFTGSQTELFKAMDNPDLIRFMTSDDPITEENYIRLSCMLTSFLRVREYAWLQYKSGVIDRNHLETEIIIIKNTLALPRTFRWWDKVGRTTYSPAFVDFVDTHLSQGEVYGEWYHLSRNWEKED